MSLLRKTHSWEKNIVPSDSQERGLTVLEKGKDGKEILKEFWKKRKSDW